MSAAPDGSGSARRPLRDGLLVAAATLACLLPFADKAFHIDDHRYVQMAQRVQEAPLDYFGFEVNLGGSRQPEAAVSHNPPLVAFYAAAAAWLVGWSERGLHLAFLLPALAATLGTWSLGRRLGADPLVAALLCLAFPVFLVSATTVMADVSMTALFCWSVWFWIRGLDRRRHGALLLAAGLAALCALTKYFGIALLPLLLAYSVYRERRLGAWAAYLLLPLVALFAYELYTLQTYGVSPILGAADYSVTTRTGETGGFERGLVAMVFAGGALVSILCLAPIAFSRRMLLANLGLGGVVLVASLAHGRLAGVALRGADGIDVNLLVHVAVFATAGAALWVLVVADLRRRRDADALLLALWVGGAFAFATVVNYTTNGRALLPLAPPVAILVARQLAGRRGAAASRAWRLAALAPAFALALGVAWGDAAQANASREAARRIAASHRGRPGTLWFDGAWGFQHYLQQAGGRAVDVRENVLRPGDWLASSTNWRLRLQLSPRAATLVDAFELPLPWVTTMLQETATGFYAIQWGPLPYRLRSGSHERFEVRRLDQLVIFEPDPHEIERRGRELERAAAALAPLLALQAARWPAAPRCAPALERLIAAVSEHCRWCATPDQCADCVDAQVEPGGLPAECAQELERALAELTARCGAQLAIAETGAGGVDPLCRQALAIRRELTGQPAATARDPGGRGAPPAARP